MNRSGIRAPKADIGKFIDRENLRGRWIKNVGTKSVLIKPDLDFKTFLHSYGREPVVMWILEVGEVIWLDNYFVSLSTDDKSPVKVLIIWDKQGLQAANKAYERGDFKNQRENNDLSEG